AENTSGGNSNTICAIPVRLLTPNRSTCPAPSPLPTSPPRPACAARPPEPQVVPDASPPVQRPGEDGNLPGRLRRRGPVARTEELQEAAGGNAGGGAVQGAVADAKAGVQDEDGGIGDVAVLPRVEQAPGRDHPPFRITQAPELGAGALFAA